MSREPDRIVGPAPFSWETILRIIFVVCLLAPVITVVCLLLFRWVERLRERIWKYYGRR